MMHGVWIVLLRSGLLVLALAFLPVTPVSAQIFRLQGGDSTLFQAQGGSMEFKGTNYSGGLGAGLFEGHFGLGANFRTQIHGYTYTAGDDTIRFDLPTDVFDNAYYFYGRGMGISQGTSDQGFYIFGGVTSNWLGTGFFQSASAQDPVAILFFHRRLSDTFRFYSRGVFSQHNTSLEALEWQPEKWLKTAVTGGIGSGKGYLASSFDAQLRTFSLRASYVAASSEFRRVMVPTILNSETDKGNVEVTYEPNHSLSFSAGHHNLLEPLDLNSPMVAASTNDLTGNFRLGGTYFGAGLFTSTVTARNTTGANLYVGHRIAERLEVTANYFESHSSGLGSNGMLTGTFRENLSPRFSLLQLVTHANGQWNLAYGGEFIANRFSAQVDYQNVYLPFRPTQPFEQALMVNASVRVFGPIQLTVASSVAPDGHIRYTFGGSTYLYRYRGLSPWQSHASESYSFPKYLVKGLVHDEEGNPISGAALRINGEIIYTDDSGRFLYRFRKHAQLKFEVVLGEFLVPGLFEVVQAPTEVTAEPESNGQSIDVTIRQRRTAPIELRQYPPRASAPAEKAPAANQSAPGKQAAPASAPPTIQ